MSPSPISDLRSKKYPLLRLLRYAKNYRIQVWTAVTCTILNQLFDLAPSYLIGVAVDVVVEKENSIIAQIGITNIVGQLAVLSLLTLLVWSLESLFEFFYDRLWRNLAQTIQHGLRLDTYTHLQQLELSYFEERSTGELLSILNDDINQLERFLNSGATEILQFLTVVLAVGGSFILIAPSVAAFAILPIPFIFWGSFAFQKQLAPRYADVREKAGFISSRLANNLSGIATIKSFTTEDYERSRVLSESDAYRRSNKKAIALSAAFYPLIRFIVVVGFIATLFFGGVAVANNRISVGTYGFLVFIVQLLLWPFASLSQIMDEYQRAMASIRRVMGLLDTPIAIPGGDRSLSLKTVRGEVQIDNITFAYSDFLPFGNASGERDSSASRAPVLKNLSLHIPAGTNIGIVGATGSGKSTLVKLLLRFYEIQSGRITIDGIDIRELQLRELRRCIGWVSQDVFLFHGTVAQNIAYGNLAASSQQIVRAAQLAEAHEFILELPQGYDTIVGERGQKLSGGQRQRIAIARAILKDPLILVLDEATSAVDNETEAAIQKSLAMITQNRTTIAIAHRLSTIRYSHCIYVMEQGQIVEQGTHEELLSVNGIYANLWCVQSGLSPTLR
ncbi:MAG: putative multidrug export ATP-binding/permease protein [Chroococcidiopsis sp. SAG 2025]|uniref:ABC transporter ATP-binding protein n=1 Tax=Chroococcidiopsis sp. SAG 2025 TaxID=171389 RepID=UPI00293705F4|nr:ABC transporter ATP-binding protein [Chroococcidiopsis sp. SAG 2025]MDV2998177.1 putative multidrug export ATP-binding/permease protein [Chroococcidiopsis sp. SAG 2025]